MNRHPIWKWLNAITVGAILSCSSILALSLAFSIAASQINLAFQGTPTPDSDGVTHPTLKLGSKGTAVSKLQAALKLLGYYDGEVDGVYGKTTVESVTKFQQAAGLTADGVVGETTWKRLFPATPIATTPKPNSSPSPSPIPSPSPTPSLEPKPDSTPATTPAPTPTTDLPTLRLGMRGEAVTGLQQRLKTLGFFSGGVDGIFGAKTKIAVKALQNKFKIKADGVVGKSTWEVILR
jgi:N-acetylmuramoyl-L-alanine amidase